MTLNLSGGDAPAGPGMTKFETINEQAPGPIPQNEPTAVWAVVPLPFSPGSPTRGLQIATSDVRNEPTAVHHVGCGCIFTRGKTKPRRSGRFLIGCDKPFPFRPELLARVSNVEDLFLRMIGYVQPHATGCNGVQPHATETRRGKTKPPSGKPTDTYPSALLSQTVQDEPKLIGWNIRLGIPLK